MEACGISGKSLSSCVWRFIDALFPFAPLLTVCQTSVCQKVLEKYPIYTCCPTSPYLCWKLISINSFSKDRGPCLCHLSIKDTRVLTQSSIYIPEIKRRLRHSAKLDFNEAIAIKSIWTALRPQRLSNELMDESISTLMCPENETVQCKPPTDMLGLSQEKPSIWPIPGLDFIVTAWKWPKWEF